MADDKPVVDLVKNDNEEQAPQQPPQQPQQQRSVPKGDGGRGQRGRRRNRGGGSGRINGGNRRPRYARQARMQGKSDELDVYPETRVLTVAGTTPPKGVAGAISHISRVTQCPDILAGGARGVNQAVKAIAIARQFLEDDGIDLTAFSESSSGRRFRRDDTGGYRFTLTKVQTRRNSSSSGSNDSGSSDSGDNEMKVSKSSSDQKVAGAIAKRVRDSKRVSIACIGADAVFTAIKSISVARRFLEQDGFDVCFKPEFIKLFLTDGVESSALRLTVLALQI